MPFESPHIVFPQLRPMLNKKLLHAVCRSCLPGMLRQIHVGRIKRSMKLLLFGGELVGEVFDFVALPLSLVALLLGFIALGRRFLGLLLGLLRAGLGLVGIG